MSDHTKLSHGVEVVFALERVGERKNNLNAFVRKFLALPI